MGDARSAGVPLNIRRNIIADAFGSAVFGAGLGYVTVNLLEVEPALVLGASVCGGFLGIAVSYPVAALTDRWGVRRVLLVLQIAQTIALFPLLFPWGKELALLAIGATVGLGRVVSPVRGALPPKYLDKGSLLEFKTTTRCAVLIAALAGAGVASLIASLGPPQALIFLPLLNALSFLVALRFTFRLPRQQELVSTTRWLGTMDLVNIGSAGGAYLVIFTLVYLLAGIVDAALPFALAQRGVSFGWLIAVANLIGIGISLAAQRVVKRRQGSSVNTRPLVLGLGAILLFCAGVLACVYVTVALSDAEFIGLILGSVVLTEIGTVLIYLVLWDVQYSVGPDDRRGAVVGMFGVACSLGMVASSGVAAAMFHRSE